MPVERAVLRAIVVVAIVTLPPPMFIPPPLAVAAVLTSLSVIELFSTVRPPLNSEIPPPFPTVSLSWIARSLIATCVAWM